MPTPATRTPVRIARGTYSNLNSSIADLQEGEICYATDQNKIYIIEGGALTEPPYLPLAGGTMTGAITFNSTQTHPKIPANSQTSAYVLVAGDAGKHINITTGGVTVNTGVFATGDAVSIYNNSGSNQTITQGTSVTLRQAGTANTGNRTLAQYGVATILCVGTDTFVISGAGLS